MFSQKLWRASLILPLCLAACGSAVTEPPRSGLPPTREEKAADVSELRRLALEQMRGGDTQRAEEYLGSALGLGGSADEILPDLMRACVAGRRYETALRYFEDYQSQLSNARRASLSVAGAVLYIGVRQPERARIALEMAVKIDPKAERAHFLLGQLLHDEFQDYGLAEQHFRAYLALAPNGVDAPIARAGLLKETDSAEVTQRPQKLPRTGPVRTRATQ